MPSLPYKRGTPVKTEMKINVFDGGNPLYKA